MSHEENVFAISFHIITNHGFLRGSSWLVCHFLLMNIYILTKGQWLEWHMYFFIDQLDYNDLVKMANGF
jgi:hypothetical protein